MDGKAGFDYLVERFASSPKESEWVEFKVNNGNPQEIGEYISALSNSACYHRQKSAYLVFGIENDSHRFVGTSFRPSKEKRGNQELENWLATQLDPRIDFNIYEVEYEGQFFVIFRIGATRDTPVKFRDNSFIRIGSYKKRLAEHPERERAIWNKERSYVFEKAICTEGVTFDEVLGLIDFEAYFDLINFPLPDSNKGILERMIWDKLIVKNGARYDITNLGALLFAKDVDQFETISRKRLRVIFYEGNSRIKTLKEQPGKRGYATGFSGLIRYLTDVLPSKEVIENGLRKQLPQYPILAIRELIANALIHQDFAVNGASPMVEIFNNRIEITNPGRPIIDPLRFLDHSPESRNEILARFMRVMNICEERGSGIDKVVFECEINQLPAPDFIVGDSYTRIILYAPKAFRNMDKQEKIRACYLHACLRYVSGDIMTNQSLRERFGIAEHNYSIASRIIADTMASDLIKGYDEDSKSKKFAKYVPYWA